MKDNELGVLIHGAGWVSPQHIIDAYKKNPYTRIVAISSRTRASAQKRAAEAGLDVPCLDNCLDNYEEALALDGVDIVSVARLSTSCRECHRRRQGGKAYRDREAGLPKA